MALTDENGSGLNVSMPVAPMGYGSGGYGSYPMMGYPVMPMMGGFGNGFGGGFNGDGGWLILLLLLAIGNGGWGGFGGFGGWGGMMGLGMADGFGAFPWLLASNANNQNSTNASFDSLQLGNQISGLRSDVTGGFSDTALGIAGVNQNICQSTGQIQNSLCSGFAGVNANISNAAAQGEIAAQGRHSALTQQLYNNELNSLNRSFAEQTANTAAINGVANQISDCCCEQRLASANLQNVIQTENCADRAALSDGVRDILTATQAQNQRILDKLCDQELQAERRENAELRTRLNMADLAASQAAQTAALVADNTAQTQYIVNRVAPYPVPSYNVPAPYGYGYGPGYGYGCNGNFGFNPFGNVGFGNGSF